MSRPIHDPHETLAFSEVDAFLANDLAKGRTWCEARQRAIHTESEMCVAASTKAKTQERENVVLEIGSSESVHTLPSSIRPRVGEGRLQ